VSDLRHPTSSSLPAVNRRAQAGKEERELRIELRIRGVFAPGPLVESVSAEAIEGAIRWYDEQPRRGPGAIGAGALYDAIRDGGMPGYGAPGEETLCPWTPELAQEWQLVIVELERIVSEDDWIIRYAPWVPHLHPHSHDVTGWTLGAQAWVPDWLGKRRAGIRRAAGCPVQIVVCEDERSQSPQPHSAVHPAGPAPAATTSPPSNRSSSPSPSPEESSR
jgi:hypothetical protein